MSMLIPIALPSLLLGTISYLFYRHQKCSISTQLASPIYFPSNTIFVFDIHGVFLHFSYTQIMAMLWHFPHKMKFFLFGCNPWVWYLALKTYWKYPSGEGFFMNMAKQFSWLYTYQSEIIQLMNCQKPIPATMKIIQKLHKKGYQLDILSNIGEKTFADLQKRYKTLFSYFSHIRIIKAKEDYICKPNKKRFMPYLRKPDSLRNIIFIDNSKENSNAAQAYGLVTIRYRSAYQLNCSLKKMKIL